jgi:taurine dehydrogenase small subunit
MSDHVRIEVLRRLVNAFNEQDVDAALELFAEDGAWETSRGPDVWGRRFSGHAELRAGMTERFGAFPDGRYSDDTHVVFGDRGFSEWTFTATTRNGEMRVRGCDIWTFEGDKIARKNSFWKIVET